MKNFRRESKPRGKRDSFNFKKRDNARPTMHKTTCDGCGASCEVPFKPSGDKPVYCDNCFKDNNDNKSSYTRRESRRDGKRYEKRNITFQSERQMHEALCDSCGETCEVPFEPKGDRAIFCEKCFGANRPLGGSKHTQREDKLDMINAKLDRILNILEPPVPLKTLREQRLQKDLEQAPDETVEEFDVDFVAMEQIIIEKPKKTTVKKKPSAKKATKKPAAKKTTTKKKAPAKKTVAKSTAKKKTPAKKATKKKKA